MRFGLVGTGYWAKITHAPALASTPGAELAAVWGRDPAAAAALAATHDATAYADFGAFLDGVDAVAFAVPPHVQAPLAVRAAQAGKHLLLEKPVALSPGDADKLVAAVEEAQVASVVFFTWRFNTEIRAWLTDEQARGGWSGEGWSGGAAIWLGTSLTADNPFNTPWRQEKGALWDLGPHLVGMLWACLGPVTRVTAVAGKADMAHLVLRHETGVTSTVTTTQSAPEAGRRGHGLRLGRGRAFPHARRACRLGHGAAQRRRRANRGRPRRGAWPRHASVRRPLRPGYHESARRGRGAAFRSAPVRKQR